MASVSELYQATATRFSVAGRVLYIPYVLFRIFLQWVHLTFLDTRTTIRHRASVLMASIFMAENDSKSLSEALDSTRYQNRLASTNLTRPVDEEIRYIFDPIENIIDIPRLASIVWLRTDYYYDRYVVHALFCFLHRFVGTRTPYLYRPSWISKPTSRNSPAQQADFEELDFQPREYCLNSMSRKTDSPGVSNFVSPAIRDRESRVASKSEQGSFANACPYITTQEPLLNFEKISSSYMSPEKPYKPISQEGHSSGASRTKKKLKIRFKRVVDVPVLSVTDYQSVRHAIEKLLDQPGYDDGSIGPNLVRFGWHCCATYDKRDGTGGSNGGTMRFPPELTDPGNTGLHTAKAYLDKIWHQFQWITHADLYTLGSVVAIEAMGGPTINWKPGRIDCADDQKVPQNGRLPVATLNADHIREVFQVRLGFNDQETVALIGGGHSLGRTHAKYSGFNGKWTDNPIRFDNEMFAVLLNEVWTTTEVPETGRIQYMNEDRALMMLNTDIELLNDPEFVQWVRIYAQDQQKFFDDFALAFGKLLELGVNRDEDGVARNKV